MQYIHYEVKAGPADIIQVKLDAQANVYLLDTINYQKYRLGKVYSFIGGLAKKSPIEFRPSGKGPWHIVIDLKGMEGGNVKSSVAVLR